VNISLKPIFLGRGVDVPLLIIFVGSLGGLVLHGILGLFLGAVVLAIGYQTYMLWIDNNENVKELSQQN
jgi:predicted PurR-regulated permease PerM